jgi:hypothetical protein
MKRASIGAGSGSTSVPLKPQPIAGAAPATEIEPKFVSSSDPAAQWTGAMGGPAFFAYADNYLIDVRAAVIVDVEASRAIRQAEVGAARTMIERTASSFGLRPQRLAERRCCPNTPVRRFLAASMSAPAIRTPGRVIECGQVFPHGS